MARYLRAVFHFRTDDDPGDVMPALKLLFRTLRILRIRDPHARLRVTPDDPSAPDYDGDGD